MVVLFVESCGCHHELIVKNHLHTVIRKCTNKNVLVFEKLSILSTKTFLVLSLLPLMQFNKVSLV